MGGAEEVEGWVGEAEEVEGLGWGSDILDSVQLSAVCALI